MYCTRKGFVSGGTARSRSRRPQPERLAAACAGQAPELWWSLVLMGNEQSGAKAGSRNARVVEDTLDELLTGALG